MNGDDFPAAASALRGAPDLEVGVHLTFVGERPLSPPSEVRSLIGRDGRSLLADYRAFLRRYYMGGIALEEVEREARRQIERAIGAGLAVRHLNSHQHLHALPPIFAVVTRLAQDLAIPYIRLPRDAHPRATRLGRWLAVRGLGRLAARDRVLLRRTSIRANDRTIGIMDAGRISAPLLLTLLDHVEGVTELVSHPGVDDPAIAERYGWGYRWSAEREALCDPAVRQKIAAERITLGGVLGMPGGSS